MKAIGENTSTWTTEKPTKPGHYWVFNADEIEEVDKIVYLARLDDLMGTLIVYMLAWEAWLTVDDFTHFMPIAEPKPPSESN